MGERMDIYYPKDNAVSHGKVRRRGGSAGLGAAWRSQAPTEGKGACVCVYARLRGCDGCD